MCSFTNAYLIVAFSLYTLWRDVMAQNWGNAAFAAINASLAFYAIWNYIGIRDSFVDMWLGLLNWLYVPDRAPRKKRADADAGSAAVEAGPVDWAGILYHGDRRLNRDLRGSNDRRRRVGTRRP